MPERGRGQPISGIEKSVELREHKEPREVVRVFVGQSLPADDVVRRYRELREESERSGKPADWRRLFLTGVLWAEKSSASEVNPGQVMPIGGKVQKSGEDGERGESFQDAANRELLEETHLRPVSVTDKIGPALSYTLHGSQGDTDIDQHAFWTEVLPTDRPYPLNPAEDKIAGFHRLTAESMGELYSFDAVKPSGASGALALVGSMRLTDEGRARDEKVSFEGHDADAPVELFGALAERLHTFEAHKRSQVMEHILEYYNVGPFERARWWAHMRNAANFYEEQGVFQDFVAVFSERDDFEKVLNIAVDLSNFQEEIWTKRKMGSNLEQIVRLMYTLLEARHKVDAYLSVAGRDEGTALRDFVERIVAFANEVGAGKEIQLNDCLFGHEVIRKLKGMETMDDEEVEDRFSGAFGFDMDAGEWQDQMDRVNKFIEDVVARGISARVGGSYQKETVSQIAEITNGSLADLIRLAFPVDGQDWKSRTGDGAEGFATKKRVVFEARRKLAYLFLFRGAGEYLESTIRAGIRPIEKLWGGAVGFPSSEQKLDYVFSRNEDGEKELADVRIGKDTIVEVEGDSQYEHTPQETILRGFAQKKKDAPGFMVSVDTRRKSTASVYRKVVALGLDDPRQVIDVFGRSLAILPDTDDARSRGYIGKVDTRTVQLGKDRGGDETEDRSVTDFAPVLDILEYWSRQPGVRVLEYKPTPQGGEAMKSHSKFGGRIRVAKFYIEHTDRAGAKRYEEVQIFSPSQDGRSSLYWLEKKKEDDARYFVDRLHDTQGLRSFLELNFPVAIYGGPIRAMQKEMIVQSSDRKKSTTRKKK